MLLASRISKTLLLGGNSFIAISMEQAQSKIEVHISVGARDGECRGMDGRSQGGRKKVNRQIVGYEHMQ